MKERPILFSAPMVRAILDGSKTQTRRVVKLPVEYSSQWSGGWHIIGKAVTIAVDMFNQLRGKPLGVDPTVCPYGQPGERLWVRETWMPKISHSCGDDVCDCETVYVNYPAGGEGMYFHGGIPEEWVMPEAAMRGKSVPSIHMPRWASRILLEIVSVRVERLNDISEADAAAEGIPIDTGAGTQFCRADNRNGFRLLWQSINGPESWDTNPWVWVVEFKRVTP